MNKRKVVGWSLIVALGGFLFGFDTAVISGAEQAIQQYWQLSTINLGLTVSAALIGTVLGALLGSLPSDKLGRKKTLILIAISFLLASIGTAMATNWCVFLFFRFLGGVGVGTSSVTAPVYISEIAPASMRGRLVAMFQFNIVLGILMAYLSNYLMAQQAEIPWRWMLGVQAFPSLLFLLLLRLVPESPRWLYTKKNKTAEATAILKQINPTNYREEMATIEKSGAEEKLSGSKNRLFTKDFKLPIFLAITFAVFNQVSGINAIIYYAPRIFKLAGLQESSSLLSTLGIGIVNFAFTLLAINFIDRIGRKKLMLIGSVGLIVTLGLVAKTFFDLFPNGISTGTSSLQGDESSGLLIVVYLLVYIAFFAFSQGAVIWVFISEIFPNSVRAKGQTLGSFTHWAMAAIIAFAFPSVSEKFGGGYTFLFFTFMMLLQLFFVWKFMPETKGKSLEQIEQALVMH